MPGAAGIALPPVPAALIGPLRSALDLAFALTAPDAIVLSGPFADTAQPSAARMKLYVLHDAAWRQRVFRRFGPLACELVINADTQTRRDLAEEAFRGRPVTAQLLAAGAPSYDPLGRAGVLAAEARMLLARGWKPADAELAWRKVQAAGLIEDARALAERDQLGAELQLSRAIEHTVDLAFAAAGRWLPAPDERARTLEQIDRATAALAAACFHGYDFGARLRAAERLADRVLGTRVVTDWIGPREPAASSGL
jgi:hypothetical protein